jgi:ubiquinone biosynthesis protein UbiJ
VASLPNSMMHNEPAAMTRGRRLRGRLIGIAAAALVLALMVYGERWQLEDAPKPALECAVAVSVAHALDEISLDN